MQAAVLLEFQADVERENDWFASTPLPVRALLRLCDGMGRSFLRLSVKTSLNIFQNFLL